MNLGTACRVSRESDFIPILRPVVSGMSTSAASAPSRNTGTICAGKGRECENLFPFTNAGRSLIIGISVTCERMPLERRLPYPCNACGRETRAAKRGRI
jgi:hypothetical protein